MTFPSHVRVSLALCTLIQGLALEVVDIASIPKPKSGQLSRELFFLAGAMRIRIEDQKNDWSRPEAIARRIVHDIRSDPGLSGAFSIAHHLELFANDLLSELTS